MKKILLSLFLTLPITVVADTYNYLNLTSTSTIQSVALKSVKKITFEGTNVVVTSTDGTTTTAALSTLSSITFTDTAVGVRGLRSSGSLQMESGRVVSNGSGQLQLFNSSGQLIRQQYVSGTRSELSLDGLPRGIYIARLGNKTIKVMH